MFDIGWGEFVVIGIVALIAIGPKELPGVLRALGQWIAKLRRMATEFQGQFQEAMREAEMADLKQEVDEMTRKATQSFDMPFDAVAEAGTPLATEPAASAPPQPTPEPAPPVTEPDIPVQTSPLPKPAEGEPRG
jgi:sec-independent protein translocase protein TatB